MKQQDVLAVIDGRTDSRTETLMAITLEKIDGLEGMSVGDVRFDPKQNALHAMLTIDLPEGENAS